MSSAAIAPDRAPPLDALRDVGERLRDVGREELAQTIAPLIGRLQGRLPGPDASAAAQEALAFCRRLYANARSGDALPLARAVLAHAVRDEDRALERQAATACGLLCADIADIVAAVEHHVHALRLAAEDPLGASGVWNNIGLAMGIAGNYEMAARCYQRAIALVEKNPVPVYSRYCTCINLALCHLQMGSHEAGLAMARRALAEETPAFREQDLLTVLRLRRNLVRLLVAAGRIDEAEPHVLDASTLAQAIGTPRAAIAAAAARGAYELAKGRVDVGLTLLERALANAREVPAALRDTLASVASAEEAAGHSERALLRLSELSDHVYRSAIDRARRHVELASIPMVAHTAIDCSAEQARARLISKRAPAAQPEEWGALDRLAVSAVMRMDSTGWHGKRVGTFCKALAIASGVAPLEALEIGLAAELHDIGMLSVPEEILRKERLGEGERAIVRRHINAGVEILSDDRDPRVFMAREIARYHHAHWDGTGFPERVGGRLIPFAARVCAVADAYDAMVSGLGCRPRKTMDEALAELRSEAGKQFDPQLVTRFDALIRTESQDLGMDLSSDSGMEGFQELVNALQEDRGFV